MRIKTPRKTPDKLLKRTRTSAVTHPDDHLFESFALERDARKKRSRHSTELKDRCRQILGSRLFFGAMLAMVIAFGAGFMLLAEKYQASVVSRDFKHRESTPVIPTTNKPSSQQAGEDELLKWMNLTGLGPAGARKHFERSSAEELQRQIQSTFGRYVEIEKIHRAKDYAASSQGQSRLRKKAGEYTGVTANDALERLRRRLDR